MKIGFCGCSITHGVGVTIEQRYSSVVGQELACETVNLAQPGRGNRDIFLQALELTTIDTDIIIIQWSAPGRQWFIPQFDRSYNTLNADEHLPYIKNRAYQTFVNIFKLMDNSYNQYMELQKHTDILRKFNKKIYYLNGLMHIDPVFLNWDPVNNLDELQDYTKQIIDFDNLPDPYIHNAIDSIRQAFEVTKNMWISTDKFGKVDIGTDGVHPGPESHRIKADMIVQYIKERND
jgi:lysophospholipase L1-like esterase